ncbi:MAG: hypothetical protein ACXVRX_14420 [Solirubrobacteraceae bacterium]
MAKAARPSGGTPYANPASSDHRGLRLAIDCLPRRTRIAMLEGIAANDIIVGAYSTPDGICPMLAAHRAGGRTSLSAFAEAWDRVAFRGQRASKARRATERELRILTAHLEASLLEEELEAGELAAVRRDHEALASQRRQRGGDPHRGAELAHRDGWAWTRVVRRYDDYERLIRRLEDARARAQKDEPALRAQAG